MQREPCNIYINTRKIYWHNHVNAVCCSRMGPAPHQGARFFQNMRYACWVYFRRSLPSLQPFRKTLSTCDLMQWKIWKNRKNRKITSGPFRHFFVSLAPLWWSLSSRNASYRVYPTNWAFSLQFEAETLRRSHSRRIDSNIDGSTSRTPEKHQEAPGGEENTGYDPNLVVSVLLEWDR